MRSINIKKWLLIGAAPSLAVALVIPTSAASVASAQAAASNRAAAVSPSGSQKVVVILRDQNAGLPARSASRRQAVQSEQSPVISQMRSAGASGIATTSLPNAVIATVAPQEAAALASNSAVEQVVPDATIPGPSPLVTSSTYQPSNVSTLAATPSCGTAADPQLDPEALSNINATPAQLDGIDGSGVTVAYLADGIDPSNPDFQRNAAFASAGSPAGSPILTQSDFSGDGTSAPTDGGEAFLDASSIAAQGNQSYDLSQYVSTSHPLPAGCDIKIVGAAPGANVMGLKVFAQNDDTTTSGFLQAIDYAVANGVQVINESFGSTNFPDTTLDAVRDADDAAVAAGVTVVVSSGDAGITSTIGSPASDSNVISVGATTTFQAYAQDTYGGINAPGANGRYVDNNISALSSGGFTQAGNTVDLVAPGDLNWALCDAKTSKFSACTNEQGHPSDIELSGGTSESSPLTAAAAADVIQAYASTHGGNDPTPALVKQILMSTATDIDATAVEQGAGLLNVKAAVKEAESIAGTTATPHGGLLVSPNQINVQQKPGATKNAPVTITNTGASPVTVTVSTRALTDQVGSTDTGSFCMQPGPPTASCPANSGAFQIWSGVTEVYQEVPFKVPASSKPSRLEFSADYPYTGQSSLLHFALLEPNGTYAAYSLPQGLGDFGEVEVANPPAGKWTAVFFTEQDGATKGGVGTSGTIQWAASAYQYAPAGAVSAGTLTIAPGGHATTRVTLTSPSTAGDSDESVVLATDSGTTTVPVTIRTVVPIGSRGGTFSGVLTGGNGRSGAQAQTNTYAFTVPSGVTDLDASVALSTDPSDEVIGFLVDPSGQTESYSSNVSTDNFGNPVSTPWVDMYAAGPEAGQWELILEWANPVSGSELSEPFSGAIQFDQVQVSSTIPNGATLPRGKAATFSVTVANNGQAPEAYFVDPRLNQPASINLPDQNGSEADMSLPLPAGLSFPYYFVPTDTSQLTGSITGSQPVTFDMEYFPGDPDVSPAVSAPGVSGSQGLYSAGLTLTEPAVSPGLWLLNPDEVGPYPASGALPATATASLTAVTPAFDGATTSSTGDFWSYANGLSSGFSPQYVPSGDSTTISVTVTPTAKPGQTVTGTLYVDDYALGSFSGATLPDADQLAAIPYSYTVGG